MRLHTPLQTERFTLRTLEPADASESYADWLADPEVSAFLETRLARQSVAELADYIAQMAESPSSYLLGMFHTESGTHLGNIKLGPIDARHNRAAIGLLIGDRAWWSQGVAKEVIAAVTRWGFDELRIHKLFAGSYASNTASIRAFLACGYTEEGRQRDHVALIDGSRDDVVLLGAVNTGLASD